MDFHKFLYSMLKNIILLIIRLLLDETLFSSMFLLLTLKKKVTKIMEIESSYISILKITCHSNKYCQYQLIKFSSQQP